jgi:hypothetical protein
MKCKASERGCWQARQFWCVVNREDKRRSWTWSRESNRGNKGPALSTSAVAAALRAANADAVFLPWEMGEE